MIKKSNPFVAGVAFGIAASAALVCVFAASSQGQSPPAGTSAAPGVRATAGPITPAGADDAQALALFTQFVGIWDVQGVATSADGKTSGPFRGESQFGWILGQLSTASSVRYQQHLCLDLMVRSLGTRSFKSTISLRDR